MTQEQIREAMLDLEESSPAQVVEVTGVGNRHVFHVEFGDDLFDLECECGPHKPGEIVRIPEREIAAFTRKHEVVDYESHLLAMI